MNVLDNKELQRLVEDHIEYAYALAKQFKTEVYTGNIEYEDIKATAVLGLCDAARRYNPENGVLFKTFTYFRIRGAMFDLLRRSSGINKSEFENKDDQVLSAYELESELITNEGNIDYPTSYAQNHEDMQQLKTFVMSLGQKIVLRQENSDLLASDKTYDNIENALILKDTISYLYRLSENLPKHERDIIQMHYFEGFSFSEIRQIYANVSRSWISRLHLRGLDRLRENIATEEKYLAEIKHC